jgi:Pentapeptide repeats (8 copies)
VTYYACLKSGKLTKVGTTAPSCVAPATQLSGNSEGPTGSQGPPGPTLNTCTMPPGPGLNYSACDLEGSEWNGVDLSGATLISAILGGSSSSSYTNYANLSNANLSWLGGCGTSFVGADLIDASFTSADLVPGCSPSCSGADFENADLAGANMTNANLQDDNFSGATLTNVT